MGAEGAGSNALNGVVRTQWLTDYNCVPSETNRLDAGVLPGYPVDTSSPPAATDAAGNTQTGVAAPTGLTPNVGVGTEAMGSARIDGGAHLCADDKVFCPAGASAQASLCQDNDCDACTGFTTEPNAGDISGAADVCCPDDGCKVNAKHLCPAAQVFCPAGSTSASHRRPARIPTAAAARVSTAPNGGDISLPGDVC